MTSLKCQVIFIRWSDSHDHDDHLADLASLLFAFPSLRALEFTLNTEIASFDDVSRDAAATFLSSLPPTLSTLTLVGEAYLLPITFALTPFLQQIPESSSLNFRSSSRSGPTTTSILVPTGDPLRKPAWLQM